MRQKGRKSAAQLLTLPAVDGLPPPRLEPPAFLDNAERTLFIDLLASCDPRHFVASDIPLLVSFVQATLMARGAARDPAQITVWEKAVRMQATLATRLRLAPQARLDPKTVARRQPDLGPKPWEEVD